MINEKKRWNSFYFVLVLRIFKIFKICFFMINKICYFILFYLFKLMRLNKDCIEIFLKNNLIFILNYM